MEYEHGHHAGNAGDVWKHVVLLALLASLKHRALTVVESHGGSGRYKLGSTGEWQAGVGRLRQAWGPGVGSGSVGVDRYLSRVRKLSGEDEASYPGSPVLVADALGPTGRLYAYELVPEVATRLRGTLKGDHRCQVQAGDGLASLATLPKGDAHLVHVDPPYASKGEWQDVATAFAAAARKHAEATFALWYPIKRLARPTTLQDAIAAAGVPFVALDLVTTPLDSAPDRLAGSGMLLVRAPTSAVAECCAAAAILGPTLSTHGRSYSLRVTSP